MIKDSLGNIFKKKRRIVIFVLSIVLPLIVVLIFSIDTFLKRQKITNDLLESNLFLTGKSAVENLEESFHELENVYLPDSLLYRILDDKIRISPEHSFLDIFILNRQYEIVIPKNNFPDDKEFTAFEDSEFSLQYGLAVRNEFALNNTEKATSYYQNTFRNSTNKKEKALALEGICRTLIKQNKSNEALTYLQLMLSEYSEIQNNSGHPLGIVAALQLIEITMLTNIDEAADSLISTYRKIKNGHWPISIASYQFFVSEIEDILNRELSNNADENLKELYIEIKNKRSEFYASLQFWELINQHIKPKIREQLLSSTNFSNAIRRILIETEESRMLVSYRGFSNANETWIGAVCFNIDSLQNSFFPRLIKSLQNEKRISISLLDEDDLDINNGWSTEDTKQFDFFFNTLPFPWRINIMQLPDSGFDSDFRVQIFTFGILFVIIFILMFFGIFLISRDMNREAEAMRLKTEFVHNVSHELKTPLSLIRLYGETLLIKKNLPDEERDDAMQIIIKESERLSHMINNILDFSKIEIGSKEFDFQSGNLDEVVTKTIESYRYHLTKKGFKIVTNIEDDLPETIFDKEAIEGLIVNLLSNAIKFSKANKEVEARLFMESNKIVFTLSDKGIGIAEKDQPAIFDRFYRSKQEAGFEARGSGLGLTIVKHIVHSHNADIQVVSNVDKGTTFRILFPVNI